MAYTFFNLSLFSEIFNKTLTISIVLFLSHKIIIIAMSGFRLNLNELLALILERTNGSIHIIIIINNYNNKHLII